MRALCIALLSIAAPAFAQTGTPASPERILVMPFENVTRDGRIFWLGEAGAVLMADDLNALGANAITREERRVAFDRLQVPPAAVLTDATVIRIGQIVGAADVVIGTFELENDVLVVQARVIALEPGRVQSRSTERGSVTDLFGMFERLARGVAPEAGRAANTAALDHPAIGAFENYIKGLVAGSSSTAVSYLNAALQVQPTFDRARLALWDIYDAQGDYERARAAVAAVPATSPSAPRAQFLTGIAEINLKRYDDAYTTFNTLPDRDKSAPALNDLGVIQLRRNGTPQTGRATAFFDKAAALDKSDSDYFFNLGYAYWQEHDTQSAISWLREAVRRNSADGDAHFVLGAALASAGSAAEANRERELAKRLSSTYAEWEKRPGDAVPKGLERIKRDIELPHALSIDEVRTAGAQRDQLELAAFYLDRGRRLFQEDNDRAALDDLNRALFLSPYEAEAHLLVGRIYLREGRVRDAVDALKIALWSADTVDAHTALADAYLAGDELVLAREEAERALALDPASSAAKETLAKIPK
jgi:tetratricopeptide (TPR) repeat protein